MWTNSPVSEKSHRDYGVSTTPTVVLVDDHRVVQSGLRSYLGAFADVEVVGAACSGTSIWIGPGGTITPPAP